MNETVLREYARLIACCGANVQKGQDVLVQAGLDQPEFVALVVEEAYKAGAREVTVRWNYQPLTKIHYQYQEVETLGTVTEWQKAREQYYCDTLPARIVLTSSDPDGLKGIDRAKMAQASRMSYPVLKPYHDARNGREQWCVAAVPGKAWAKKVFPGVSEEEAVAKLWDAILSASRVDGDPVKAWEEHNRNMASRCAYLNALGINEIRFTAANGTDLTVGMIPESQFCGGGETSKEGIFFNPNIPTEECFTTPMRGKAEGIVYSTKPLSYQGQLIDNFWVRFHEGKAVEVGAEVGQDLLETMISMDEGAAYLGECALVPVASPISESGLLFYNTLFDENAACHLALGAGYADTIKDYHNKTLEECQALGVNDSMIHVDFMIGCDTMNIDAICNDGKTVRIFENGNWAF